LHAAVTLPKTVFSGVPATQFGRAIKIGNRYYHHRKQSRAAERTNRGQKTFKGLLMTLFRRKVDR